MIIPSSERNMIQRKKRHDTGIDGVKGIQELSVNDSDPVKRLSEWHQTSRSAPSTYLAISVPG